MCGSAGGAEYMLFCVDCGEAFHSYCADLPLSTMTPAFRLTWRCTNCKLCEICGIATEDNGNCLVYCGKCVSLIEGLVPSGSYSLFTLHKILCLIAFYCPPYSPFVLFRKNVTSFLLLTPYSFAHQKLFRML